MSASHRSPCRASSSIAAPIHRRTRGRVDGGHVMRFFTPPGRRITALVVLIAFLVRSSIPVYAESPVKLRNFIGTIDIADEGVTTFTLEGSASHLGSFTASGEVKFEPGAEEGTLIGHGVAVFEAANGDLLV